MKQCPTCQKEFPDSMRFCQTDGTPLVEAAEQAPPPDPYKTVVGGAIKMDEDILQIPEQDDLMKTMVSPPKMDMPKAEPPKPFSEPSSNVPPKPESSSQEAPKFSPPNQSPFGSGELKQSPPANVSSNPFSSSEPAKSEPVPPPKPFNETPKIDSSSPKGDSPVGSSPFSKQSGKSESPFDKPPSIPVSSPFDKPTGSPGSSPFDSPSNAPSSSPFEKTPPPPYKEPEPFGAKQPPPFGGSPFDQPQTPFSQQNEPMNEPFQQNEWAPPPAPVSGWQDQGLGANTPFQPPAVSANTGQNQTLAIVTLILGILSLPCLAYFSGIPALITGFITLRNVKRDPTAYGGKVMAIIGMVLGALGTIGWGLYTIFILYVMLVASR